MALELKIPITADAKSAISGLNDTADSASKLFRKFAEGKATLEQFEKQLGEDVAVAASKAGYGLKGYEAQYKGLLNFMERARQKWGNESEIYKDIAASADYAKSEISRLKLEEEGLAGATNAYATAVKNAAPAVDKFATANKELDSTSKSYLTRLVTLTKNILTFQLIMGPIRSALSGVKNTLKESVKIAAEAEQVYSKLATVFDGFENSARRASLALASSIGVAGSTSASALSTVGDLLQAQGMGTADSLLKSAEWVKQFQDIIAFKDINMSLEEFAQNFMSGAAGNLRNFRTFGSIVKESAVNARLAAEGLDKLTGSQLELAKMTARANLALEQQANAMGATEREWDTMLSINRRLNEAWKEYKENLGDSLNNFIKPMKTYWTDILERINKVNRAQKEYSAGNRNFENYYDLSNPDDYKTFSQDVGAAAENARQFYDQRSGYLDTLRELGKNVGDIFDTPAFNEFKKQIIMFNATTEDLRKLLGEDFPEEIYAWIDTLKEERERQKRREEREKTLAGLADSYNSFAESLLGITGVNFQSSDFSMAKNFAGSDNAASFMENQIAFAIMSNISSALESVSTADLASTFGDVISGALDELDEAGLREAQIQSLRKIFESAWNEFAKDGFTKEEKAKLEEIKASYKQATDALDEYNKKIQRQNALLNANATIASAMSSYTRLKYENGLTGSQAENDYEMATVWDIPLQIAEFAKALREVGVDIKTVTERSKAYQRVLEQEAALKFRAAFAAERNAVLDPYRSSAENYRTQYLNLGLSDVQATRNKLMEEYNQAVVDEDNELITAISGTILWFDKLQGALKEQEQIEAQKALKEQINPFTSTIDAYNTGKTALEDKKFSVFGEPYELTGFGAGIIGILTQLLSQTEVFSELTNVVSDTIVPILDAVMKPLIPMINVVKTIFDLLPWETLFEIFKMVAEVVVAISFPIRIICAVVKNIYTAVHNILQRILHPITGGDQWKYESLEKILDDTNEKLEKIRGLTFNIERNTEKDDLATLRELYRNKVISEQQFYTGARVLQKDIPFEALDSYRPSTTVRNEYNITINANDEAGLAKVERILEQNDIPVTHAWAGYSASAVGRYQMAMGGR